MLMAVTSTALAIVREKESGTIEQVRMAPIGTFPFIAGKAVPHFVIALGSGALVFGASMLLFGLPMRGNWFTLALALSLYLVVRSPPGYSCRPSRTRSRSRSRSRCWSRCCRR